MQISAEHLLAQLLAAPQRLTQDAPKDARGLYGLVDHLGQLRYIGSTKSLGQTLFSRIHQKHRSGSEHLSHYFSTMYNTGRMWRERLDPSTKADGNISKKLRNAFIARHCRAVWIVLPDSADIGRLEAEVIRIAPAQSTSWNGRKAVAYDEPVELVDETIRHLGWGERENAALERQRKCSQEAKYTVRVESTKASIEVPPFPNGPFRFVALDVETANNDRASICQIGVACVYPDNTIVTWKTYVDPQTQLWPSAVLHGISAQTVADAPVFAEVMAMLCRALKAVTVYQHSNFDRSAITAACKQVGLSPPDWDWRDSLHVARQAWPELRHNGGHGLANLKTALSLRFDHHDAGEDARAAAQVVLMAEQFGQVPRSRPQVVRLAAATSEPVAMASVLTATPGRADARVLGEVLITQGNIDHSHIYLRGFFDGFPADAIGGGNRATAAPRQVSVDTGGESPVFTDLDGSKKIFRDRSLAREFFGRHTAKAGDFAIVERIAPYQYRLRFRRS